MTTLINLAVVAIVIYLIWWLLNRIPMPEPIRLVVTVVFVIVAIMSLLGFLSYGHMPLLPRLRY